MSKSKDLSKRQNSLLSKIGNEWKLAVEIILSVGEEVSPATTKRDLKMLFDLKLIERRGAGRATQYRRSIQSQFLGSVNLDSYFELPQDDRGQNIRFNLNIFKLLETLDIFSPSENKILETLRSEYQQNIKSLSPAILKREFERVTIDLSWKSSSIEGNTYTLLETETLLKDGIPAEGKTKEEAVMLLNHKSALNYIRDHAGDFKEISVKKIENIHSILSNNLNISKNVRKRLVGITGTNYKPLDNEFQIQEVLESLCLVINESKNIFEKSFLAILLISYIQPFEDGNKRTARLIGNALLLANECFPLSFRSVDVTNYKKSMLLFYETNNLSAFKKLFIEQAKFAVKEYFR